MMGKFMNYKIATQLFEIEALFQGHLSGDGWNEYNFRFEWGSDQCLNMFVCERRENKIIWLNKENLYVLVIIGRQTYNYMCY